MATSTLVPVITITPTERMMDMIIAAMASLERANKSTKAPRVMAEVIRMFGDELTEGDFRENKSYKHGASYQYSYMVTITHAATRLRNMGILAPVCNVGDDWRMSGWQTPKPAKIVTCGSCWTVHREGVECY